MKTIGTSTKGRGHIVELTPEEYANLSDLCVSQGGNNFFGETYAEADLAPALKAIGAYANYSLILQKMANLTQELRHKLDHPEES